MKSYTYYHRKNKLIKITVLGTKDSEANDELALLVINSWDWFMESIIPI
jgi:hypothetical protein